MYLFSDVLLLGLVAFAFCLSIYIRSEGIHHRGPRCVSTIFGALARRFTNNQESIDVSFLAICSDSLLGLSSVFAFSAVVDERMHISSMVAQPISSREPRNSAMDVAET